MKIVFVGQAGCGKSTLATMVFAALKQSGRSVEHVDEFIRRDIQANGAMTSIWEQYRTRQHQKDIEDAVPSAVKYVICDSGTISPYFYACLYVNANDPRQRIVLQDMYKYLLDDLYLRRYDLIFFLPALQNVNLADGTRYQTEGELDTLDQHMKLFFTKLHNLPSIHAVNCDLSKRLDEVMWKILGHGEPELHADDLAKIVRSNVESI